jgi:hypothetical protein
VQLHLTIDLRAVILGFVLLLVATGVAAPFAISLADDEPRDETSPAQAITLGTAFTYQGQLNDGSGPANGTYDFQFRLFDDLGATVPTAGTPPAGLSRTVVVADGLFSVSLDFGATPFDGNARFLEVSVKANGAGGVFAALDPLQALSVVPQAIFAMKAGSADNVAWANVTTKPAGFADDIDNDTTYSAGAGLALTGPQFSVQFLGAGSVSGNATSAARSDHTHFGQTWTGDADFGLNVTSQSPSGGAIAVYGYAVDGYGVRGGATSGIGLRGDSTSNYGIYAQSVSGTALGAVTTGGIGVYAQNTSNQAALVARNLGNGYSMDAAGRDGGIFRGTHVGLLAFGGVEANGTASGFVGHGVYGLGRGSGTAGAGIQGENLPGGAGTFAGYFSGNLAYTGTLSNASDLRLKRNVLPLSYGLNEIEALKPVSFVLKDDRDEARQFGLIAQDVQGVIPELVVEDVDTGMLSMRYIELIPVLIKAIQEQQAQIEALRTSSEPRPPRALETAPIVDSSAWSPVEVLRQPVRPSNAAIYAASVAVLVFGLGQFAVAWRVPRSRAPLGR